MRLAAIDLGTNSFHLVITDTKPNGSFQVIESDKEMVRLGETGRDMKSLTPEAMDRGIAALRRFRAIIASRKATVIKAVATSAIREAENREQFIRRARLEAGFEIEVISGFEEGRLIYLGSLQALPNFSKKILLIDIGGGSAEYVIGERGEVKYVNSLKLGAIRVSHQYNLLGRPRSIDILNCRKHISGELGMTLRAIKSQGFKIAVGTSGTIQSIAAIIALGRPYNERVQSDRLNSFKFFRSEVQLVVERLIASPTIEARARIPGLDAKRADIILGGALVLLESMRVLGIESMIVSNFALREGVIYDQIHTHLRKGQQDVTRLHDIRERSVRHLGERTNYERTHADQVAKLAVLLFDRTQRLHKLNSEARSYLYYAALLHDIGYYISHSEHHKHSYYMISNAELLGFTNEEIEIIANVARYHRKSHPKLKHEGFVKLATDEHRELVRRLSAILRVADGLDRGHIAAVSSFSLTSSRAGLNLALMGNKETPRGLTLEIWGAERKKLLFEEVFGRVLTFQDISPKRRKKRKATAIKPGTKKLPKRPTKQSAKPKAKKVEASPKRSIKKRVSKQLLTKAKGTRKRN
jgi:exopolyphosphatase/guanosine-5'-triphosphate,3'-diphosphate pyrophosphatase